AEADELALFDNLDTLCEQADIICRHFCGNHVDSCSIVNARSGLCSEDCKWCAQSSHHSTGCDVYESLPYQETLDAARTNEREGISKFSLVTSGRALNDRDIDKFAQYYRGLSEDTNLYLCASMGLLDENKLRRLKESGVRRYHCNMETSDEYFRTLCTSHTPEDKRETIRAAKRVGLEVCSGGIIGMGESLAQRIDFAFELADLDVDSVPLNILNPIPGTPLADTPLISEEDIIRTAAIFRFILPRKSIRFAGGRKRLSHEAMLRMMRGGVNGVLMGDMLTTISNTVNEDRRLFNEAGWQF
ncbi:MAG: biotin synthase BioB, partial [Muribaculaceae bacterium]|nr:biotin synthase BioB [Muribaculaceae bacterium]